MVNKFKKQLKIFSNYPIIKSKGVLFLIPAGLSFIIYYLTLLQEVLSGDSAELILQAYRIGATHSPGYPVYILLGKFFIILFSDPVFSINLLSAICTSLSVGIMSLLIFELINNRTISIIIALFFSFSPILWPMAISAEVYNVNLLFLSLSIYALLIWNKKSSYLLLFISALMFGISLGTYLANLLLLPAFFFIIFIRKKNRIQNLTIFLSITAILGLLTLVLSILASNSVPPLSVTNLPNTVMGSLKYFTGYGYGTVQAQKLDFYLFRIFEHSKIFINNFTGVGVLLGLIGAYKQFRTNRIIAIFFLLIVIIDFGYFTSYQAEGYYLMVTVVYFIFYTWTAYGLLLIYSNLYELKSALIASVILLCVTQVIHQLPDKFDRAKNYYVTNFAIESLNKMPANAIIVCGWGKYTPFLYFQRTQSIRQDITVMLPENGYFDGKKIENYFNVIDANIKTRPIFVEDVFVDEFEPIFRQQYEISLFDSSWYQIR